MKRFSIRLRFTALYSGLFLITAAILLVTMNLLLQQNLHRQIAGIPAASAGFTERRIPPPGANLEIDAALRSLPRTLLAYQWLIASVMITVLTLISIVIGWWLAGRALRPPGRWVCAGTYALAARAHSGASGITLLNLDLQMSHAGFAHRVGVGVAPELARSKQLQGLLEAIFRPAFRLRDRPIWRAPR